MEKSVRTGTSLLLVLTGCGGGGASAPPPSGAAYAFTVLTYPGAFATGARGINRDGEIAAYHQDDPADETDTHALLYAGGAWTVIDPPAAVDDARAMGINDTSEICGSYQSGSRGQIGFVLDGAGVRDGLRADPLP